MSVAAPDEPSIHVPAIVEFDSLNGVTSFTIGLDKITDVSLIT